MDKYSTKQLIRQKLYFLQMDGELISLNGKNFCSMEELITQKSLQTTKKLFTCLKKMLILKLQLVRRNIQYIYKTLKLNEKELELSLNYIQAYIRNIFNADFMLFSFTTSLGLCYKTTLIQEISAYSMQLVNFLGIIMFKLKNLML